MKVLKILGVIIGILLLAYLVLYMAGPDKVHVERSLTIDASAEELYNELNKFDTYNEWSSWYEKDPNADYSIEGPASGVGAKFSWVSEKPDVGSGSMTIDSVDQNSMILYRMQFGFPGEQYARFIFEEEGDGTLVTWTYEEEPISFVKAMYVFMDMEEMLGPDYEKGLSNLKSYMESKPAPEPEMSEEMMESDSTAMDSTVMEE